MAVLQVSRSFVLKRGVDNFEFALFKPINFVSVPAARITKPEITKSEFYRYNNLSPPPLFGENQPAAHHVLSGVGWKPPRPNVAVDELDDYDGALVSKWPGNNAWLMGLSARETAVEGSTVPTAAPGTVIVESCCSAEIKFRCSKLARRARVATSRFVTKSRKKHRNDNMHTCSNVLHTKSLTANVSYEEPSSALFGSM